MPTSKTIKPKETHYNNDLPIIYVDGVETGHREDGINYLSFSTTIPDLVMEQVRLIVDDDHLHTIIETLCRTTNYFPKKAKKTGKTKRVPTKS